MRPTIPTSYTPNRYLAAPPPRHLRLCTLYSSNHKVYSPNDLVVILHQHMPLCTKFNRGNLILSDHSLFAEIKLTYNTTALSWHWRLNENLLQDTQILANVIRAGYNNISDSYPMQIELTSEYSLNMGLG